MVSPEVISRLVGILTWKIEGSALANFQRQMTATQKRMQELGREAERLQRKLNLRLGVKGGNTAQTKLATEIARNQDKQLRREALLQRARKATFQAELAQSKLVSTGQKEDVSLATAKVKLQQQAAILESKKAAAQAATLKAQGIEQRTQQSLLAAKARQTRLEQLVQQTAIKTQTLQARHTQTLTGVQRAELALQQARERGQRQAQQFEERRASQQARESRQAASAEQRASRFKFAEERHTAWQADRARRESERSDGGSVSLMGLAGTAAGITAAVYLAQKAFNALADRVAERQTGASETQQFNTALETAGGKRPEDQKYARERYLEISDKYGMEVSLESAKDYAKFVQGQIALGKTLAQATQIFADQSATFRAAALNGEAQKRAAYQLNQIRAKGKPEGSDVNDLFDAIGGPVASSIRQAAADRLKFKGPVADQAGWFKAQVTAGQILAKDFDQGMTNFLKANQDVLAKQMTSIDAAQTRADNQAFVANNSVNSSPELTEAVQENITAHRQLNEAMEPLRNTMLAFDIGLTNLSTALLRFAANRNLDGTEKTDQQKLQDTMSTSDIAVDTNMVGVGDYSKVDGNTQHQGGPIGKFWNWVLGIDEPTPPKPLWNQYNPINGLGGELSPRELTPADTMNNLPMLSSPAMINFASMLDNMSLPVMTADDLARNVDRRYSGYGGAGAVPGALAPQMTTNNVTNVAPANVNITNNITAPAGTDTEELGRIIEETVKDGVRRELAYKFESYLPKEVK